MKTTLSLLALFGALTILPAALSDASASSAKASKAACDASCGQCDPGSCPVPCGGSCSLGK